MAALRLWWGRRLLARHGDTQSFLGADEVFEFFGSGVELNPVGLSGELAVFRPVVVADGGVALSLPTSVVSSAVKVIGWVASMRPSSTLMPSI